MPRPALVLLSDVAFMLGDGLAALWRGTRRTFSAIGRVLAGGTMRLWALIGGLGGWLFANLSRLGALVMLAVAVLVAVRVFSEPVLIEPLQVSADLKESVFTGDALTRTMIDHVSHFSRVVREDMLDRDTQAFDLSVGAPDMEIPGVRVSVQQVANVVRRALGLSDHRIAGELYLSQAQGARELPGFQCPDKTQRVHLRLRLRSNRAGTLYEDGEVQCVATSKPLGVDPDLVSRLLLRAALETWGQISPCGAATYYFTHWRNALFDGTLLDPKLEATERLTRKCLVQDNNRHAAYAYYLQGRLRQAKGQPYEAEESFDAAARLHLSFILRVRIAMNRLLARLGIDGFPSHFSVLYAHRGNSFMDRRSSESEARHRELLQAIEHYRTALAYDRNLALAYSGLGNALAELEKLGEGPGAAIAAMCAYRNGGDRRRFDAMLRHNLGTSLDRYARVIGSEESASRLADPEKRWAEVRLHRLVAEHCRKSPLRDLTDERTTLARAYGLHAKSVDLEPENVRYVLSSGATALALARKSAGAASERASDRGRATTMAWQAFLQARRLSDGDSFEAWEGLSELLVMKGEEAAIADLWREAAATFDRLSIRRQAQDTWCILHAGRAQLRLGDRPAAVEWFGQAIEIDPRFAPAHLWLARTLDEASERSRILQHYQIVLQFDAQSLDANDRARMAAMTDAAPGK